MIAMPDLVAPRRGARQTVDSAVPSLLRIGVDIDRIRLRPAGGGWITGTVVGQTPAAGSELTAESRVTLWVAGFGAVSSLPYPMRDSRDGEFRTEELFGVFDTPIQRLLLHIRAAGGLLDLHPDDPEGAARWIAEIFCLPTEPWPRDHWYNVARLLPSLHRIAGRANGPALALNAVFGVAASSVRLVSGIAPVPNGRRTRLGTHNGRLGIDAIAGDGVTAHTAVEIEIGPIDLPTYWRMQRPGERAQRQVLYRLVLPVHLRGDVRERWRVGTPSQGASVGDPARPAALGLNSYLGGYERT